MSGLCKYKYSLGIPGKGVHKHYMGIAYMDVIGTIGIALLLYLIFPKSNLFAILALLFLLGIFLHRLFCVETTIDKYLFGRST
jgi:hypothetical protein